MLPAHLGGYGAPPSLIWAATELFTGANPTAYFYTGGTLMAHVLDEIATDEQRRRFVEPLVERRWGGTMVLTDTMQRTFDELVSGGEEVDRLVLDRLLAIERPHPRRSARYAREAVDERFVAELDRISPTSAPPFAAEPKPAARFQHDALDRLIEIRRHARQDARPHLRTVRIAMELLIGGLLDARPRGARTCSYLEARRAMKSSRVFARGKGSLGTGSPSASQSGAQPLLAVHSMKRPGGASARTLALADLERMVDTTNEWILERTGISERHILEPGLAVESFA